ncbi:MAG: PAS domain-containing protein, partial [Terriglobales bacterium]
MSSTFFDNPSFLRAVLEDLPVGIYVVDREQRIRFWNHGAEDLVGHLAHEVVGRVSAEHFVEARDTQGQFAADDKSPVALTIHDGKARQMNTYFLHKEGHRIAVAMRCRAIVSNGDAVQGAIVLFEPASESRNQADEPAFYGCLDTLTGIPAQRLTRAMLAESMNVMEESRLGFGLLRIRVLGLDEFRANHGPRSIAPFLRAAAHTLSHSMDPANFLGRWGEDEFIAVLPGSNPLFTAAEAATAWSLVTSSEIRWWGDRFPVQAVVMHTVAQPGDKIEKLLNSLEPTH